METHLSWFKLFRFDDDGSNGDAPDGGASAGAADGDQAAGGADGDKPDDFKPITSQKDLDRVISDRLRRQKEQFKDYDDAKAKAAKFDELAAAQQTDLERAQQAQAAAEAHAAETLDRANGRLIRGEVKGLAGAMKFIDPDDAYALVTSDPAKYGEISVDDDGNVVGAQDALAALVAAKAHLVESKRLTGDADGGARGGSSGKTNFREAQDDDFKAELAKHGIRSRS